MIREEIKKLAENAIKKLYKIKAEVSIDNSGNKDFGDYSTNAALLFKKNPQEIAGNIKSPVLERIEVRNGFINFFVSKNYLQKQVGEILKQKEKFGSLKAGKGEKVNVEFISANPTGPLTLGNGRGGFCGDVLANVLSKVGFKVRREYYVNDRGEQIVKLGHSVLGDSQAVYRGPYIEEIKERIKSKSALKAGQETAKIILEEMIKPSVRKMGIKFDVWFSEKSLYEKKEVNKALNLLREKDLVYEKEGALWFKSTQFGDDKDRVLVKENGEATYLASDIAYLKNKFKRGFNRLIFFWGADHYGYIERIKSAAEALGYKKEQIGIIIMQLVQLFWQGKEVKMSKRTGIYLTIDEIIEEAGLDSARFFFLARSPGSHLNFDMDLAKEQSEKNPVYYVQYAHARICSILRKYEMQKLKTKTTTQNLKLLTHSSELNLIKQLIRLPEIVQDTAKDCQVQRLTQYAIELAGALHQFYQDCQVLLPDDQNLTQARLCLILAAKTVLKNTLDLLGIKALEQM